jgi:hypothetical protein
VQEVFGTLQQLGGEHALRRLHSKNGHYTFRGDGQLIDLDAIVAGLELG